MTELVTNLHIHTVYSDGTGTHQEIAAAALQAGLDVVIITDHDILVQGLEGYHHNDTHRLLMLVGEEIHDPVRDPQKNHLLVLGVPREMVTYAPDPQNLIDQVYKAAGLSFIAHPVDPELKLFGEGDYSWVSWDVRGFTGIELWNGFSELKSVITSQLNGVFYAFFPQYIARGPLPATLKLWDDLLKKGQKVVAVGGADAHALRKSMGPVHKTVFPYAFHFRAVNTHLLTDHELTGNLAEDKAMIYDALRQGHAFIGYDMPAPTRGFRFNAQGLDATASIGDEIRVGNGVTLQIRLPQKAECRLVCNGRQVRTWTDREVCAHTAVEPGAYRVECYLDFLGQRRGWIFSNPIYVLPNR